MASHLSISSAYFYVSSFDNKTTNLKALFTYNFDIETDNSNLLNKWVTHRFNICTATQVEDYKL